MSQRSATYHYGNESWKGVDLPSRGKAKDLQRKANGPTATAEAPAIVYDVLKSPGHPLDPATRTFMESRFDHDFSGVRLHTDARAAESARAVHARAYTVGSDIVVGAGQLNHAGAPWLMAHELAHVRQQAQSPASDTAGLTVSSPSSALESEAHRAADLVVHGQSAAVTRTGPPAIHRSVFGDIVGGGLGAAAGAGLGFLLGGPIGAIAGGLVGGLAGLIAGESLSVDSRRLTSTEKTEAEKVFGNTLDYDKVRLADSPIMGIGGYARTPFNTAYFPSGTLKGGGPNMPWLIHELTHIWQTQHGVSVLTKLGTAIRGSSAYEYGGEKALREAASKGKKFTEFNTEQQADILMDYYKALTSGRDVSAYLPLVYEVQGIIGPGDFPTPPKDTAVA